MAKNNRKKPHLSTVSANNVDAHSTYINPSHDDSHQTSPGVVVSFLPFTVRDTYWGLKNSNNKVSDALKINEPIVVVNDVTRVTVSSSKGQAIDTAELVLTSGDVNYSAAIANGDHCLIWMLNNQDDWKTVSEKVLNTRKSINTKHSGLKFIGKVNSIRQSLSTTPDGKKTYRYLVTLTGFSELQTQVYFNELLSPALAANSQTDSSVQFFAQVSEQYRNLFKDLKNDGRLATETLISFFVDVFMGPGPKDAAKLVDSKLTQTPNAAFLVPVQLAQYLGLHLGEKAEKSLGVQYSDLLQRVFGQQKYSNSMFPEFTSGGRTNYFRCQNLKGGTLIPPANFNNTTLWSILTQFMNPSLNEIYTTLKYIPSKNGIFPTLNLRQMPFTTDHLKTTYRERATFFSNLPRWKINLNYPILNYNLGTSDAERFNFFQVYTNSIANNDPQKAMEMQLVLGNSRIDMGDIIRTGPRIHSTTSDTEAAIQSDGSNQPSAINDWAELISDFFANGHLKMNGSMTVAGIQLPIAVGDNVQFDNKLFHIEGLQHTYEVDPGKGNKTFLTNIMMSHGHYIGANGKLQFMADNFHRRHNMPDQLLPGFTDEERYINDHMISSHAADQSEPTSKQQSKEEFIKNQTASAIDKLKNAFLKKQGG